MPLIARIVIILMLLPVIAYCIFGVLATFEPPGSVGWRVAYIVIGMASLAAGSWALVARRGPKNRNSKSE